MMQIQYTMNLNPRRFELGTTLSRIGLYGRRWQPQRQTIGIGFPPTQITGDEA